MVGSLSKISLAVFKAFERFFHVFQLKLKAFDAAATFFTSRNTALMLNIQQTFIRVQIKLNFHVRLKIFENIDFKTLKKWQWRKL